jgi:hypothetical protein
MNDLRDKPYNITSVLVTKLHLGENETQKYLTQGERRKQTNLEVLNLKSDAWYSKIAENKTLI